MNQAQPRALPPLGNPHERYEGLDVLRGLAAVYVMLSHYTSYCLDKFGSTPFHVVRETGEYAVWLFFMISGFVIFFTLERSRTVADFAVSRVSRLYPAYWFTLTFGVVMEIFWFQKDVFWLTGYLVNMTMFQEFLGFPHHDGVYWTLTVELSFYLLMALLLRVGRLALIEILGTVWIAVALAIVALDHGVGLALPKWLVRSLIFSHFPLFFVGILIYLNRVHGYSVRRVGLMILSVSAVGVTLGPVHALVAAPLAVLATFAVSKRGHLLVNRPLLFLGAISYSLYLSHRVLGYALLTDLHRRGWSTPSALAFTIAMALLLATLVTFLVERPSCAWLRTRYRSWRSTRAISAE